MTNADQALKEFDTTGTAEDVAVPTSSTPSIKIHDQDATKVGQFVSGKLLDYRQHTANGQTNNFLDIRLEKTDATATTKRGKQYVETPVKEGDIVSVFASSRLYKQVSSLPVGTRVFMKYEGWKRINGKDGHSYAVKSLPGALTEQDMKYIEGRKKAAATRAASAADVTKSKAENADEAKAAMEKLED